MTPGRGPQELSERLKRLIRDEARRLLADPEHGGLLRREIESVVEEALDDALVEAVRPIVARALARYVSTPPVTEPPPGPAPSDDRPRPARRRPTARAGGSEPAVRGEGKAAAPAPGPTGKPALYVYGIVRLPESSAGPGCAADPRAVLGSEATGVDNAAVTVVCGSALGGTVLAAAVHECVPEPYASQQRDQVETWVLAHERVLEALRARHQGVLPLGFDTIVYRPGCDARTILRDWLDRNRPRLEQLLDRIAGKAEYVVQVCVDAKTLAERVASADSGIAALGRRAQHMPEGTAYMARQQISRAVADRVEEEIAARARFVIDQVRPLCDDLRVEKNRPAAEGHQRMAVNLSCLVAEERVTELGETLETIGRSPEVQVRFTGPWPPYSFVELRPEAETSSPGDGMTELQEQVVPEQASSGAPGTGPASGG